ncbi:MAG TPA: DUF2752 domain-containing protein [Ktedonobacterales bacterium]|nr:DUF2752 domain-containing protein [Ktedonobacterales bacterium]
MPPPAERAARMLWLAAPFALLALPTRWLTAAPSVCLIRRVTGRPCPGCGMTRALSRLAHGDPRGAWRDNRRVVIVAPLLVGLWLRTLANTIQQRPRLLAS